MRWPVRGVSRLLSLTSEVPCYVHIDSKTTASLKRQGELKLSITRDIQSPLVLSPGEFGSIVLEAVLDDVLPDKPSTRFLWNIEVKCQEGLILSGLRGQSICYLHYPPDYVVEYYLSKTIWGLKVEPGKSEQTYSFVWELVVPTFMLSSCLINVRVNQDEQSKKE